VPNAAASVVEHVPIARLRAGSPIEGVFACTRKDRMTARTGTAYLAVELRDASGSIQARAFRDADFLAGRFDRGDLVRVKGRVDRFRDELSAELTEIARVEPGEADPADFLPNAYRDLDELDGFLEHLAREVCDPALGRLLNAFLGDDAFRAELRRAPCTRAGHHAYLGGLLEHTVAVATLAQEACNLHRRLDSDLLTAAAILHDIGKTREFTLGAEIGLSDEGRLIGHLAIGQEMVAERAARVDGLDDARLLALRHCIAAHHGCRRAARPALRLARGARALPPERARRVGEGRTRARAGARFAMRIRAARRDDFEAVTHLLEDLGRPAVTSATEADCRALYEDQIVQPDTHHIVAEDPSGAVVAFASVHFRGRLNHPTEEAWIPDLIVAEHARRQGLGRMLLEEAQRRARERGCHGFTLESAYHRAEAHHMYRQFRMRDVSKAFYKQLRSTR
jgi:3'-5' exoribonuclease